MATTINVAIFIENIADVNAISLEIPENGLLESSAILVVYVVAITEDVN